jgi:hypothetical protein
MNVPVTDKQRAAIIDEVAAYTEPPSLQADEFTVRMYANQTGISMKLARNHLLAAVEAGKLKNRKVKHDGSRCWAFRTAD